MSDDVFILTVDTIQNINADDVIYFPDSITVIGSGKDASEFTKDAHSKLRTKAKKLGANVILGVKYTKPEKGVGWWTMVTGTPAYVYGIQEVFRQFKDSTDENRSDD